MGWLGNLSPFSATYDAFVVLVTSPQVQMKSLREIAYKDSAVVLSIRWRSRAKSNLGLTDNFFNNAAMHIGQPEIAPGVAVGELFVIKTH